MTRKLIVASMFAATAIAAIGCASQPSSPPYSLTGESQSQVAQHEQWRQRQMYTDEKGHYHPDLAAAQRPLQYVPQ